VLSLTNHSLFGAGNMSVEQQLYAHVQTIAELGNCFMDLHPGNVLVRPAHSGSLALLPPRRPLANMADGGWESVRWESVLTDFDSQYMLWTPQLSVDCRKLMMLSMLGLGIACMRGVTPRAAFEDEIKRLMRAGRSELGKNCMAKGESAFSQWTMHLRRLPLEGDGCSVNGLGVVPALTRRWSAGLAPL